jgi:uncharacterized protein (DUF1697 family)
MKHVALLRGINVGGKNMLPMKELCALFAATGCANVQSYIQSGNVIFDAPARALGKLGERVGEAIEERFGFRPPIVLRSAKQLAAACDRVPFPDTPHVHVGFLAQAPTKPQLAALDPGFGAPDRYIVHGSEVYLHLPNGMGRSKLGTGYFDKRIGTTTFRNWNTVVELARLTAA